MSYQGILGGFTRPDDGENSFKLDDAELDYREALEANYNAAAPNNIDRPPAANCGPRLQALLEEICAASDDRVHCLVAALQKQQGLDELDLRAVAFVEAPGGGGSICLLPAQARRGAWGEIVDQLRLLDPLLLDVRGFGTRASQVYAVGLLMEECMIQSMPSPVVPEGSPSKVSLAPSLAAPLAITQTKVERTEARALEQQNKFRNLYRVEYPPGQVPQNALLAKLFEAADRNTYPNTIGCSYLNMDLGANYGESEHHVLHVDASGAISTGGGALKKAQLDTPFDVLRAFNRFGQAYVLVSTGKLCPETHVGGGAGQLVAGGDDHWASQGAFQQLYQVLEAEGAATLSTEALKTVLWQLSKLIAQAVGTGSSGMSASRAFIHLVPEAMRLLMYYKVRACVRSHPITCATS